MSASSQQALSLQVEHKLMDALQRCPEGVHMASLAWRASVSVGATHRRLLKLLECGAVLRIPDPSHGQPRRVRWCLPDAAEATKASIAEARERSKVKRGHGLGAFPLKPLPRDSNGHEYVPAPVDMRYHVEKPEPFFSAMRPGSYIKTGSALARAYGEQA